MIDFSISPEAQTLVDTVAKFVRTKVEPLEALMDREDAFPLEQVRALRKEAQALGLAAMAMPVEDGGGGLSCVELCLVEEQIGRVASGLTRNIFVHVYPILSHGTEQQRKKYLEPLIQGDKVCAIGITEPEAGSDAANIRTTAVRDGSSWIINGQKHFISDGDIADYIIVMAVTDPEKRSRGGFTAFLIDKGTPGFRIGRTQRMMGLHGHGGQTELFFDNCRVDDDKVLGPVGAGFRLIMHSISRVRLANIGARAVGMATRVMELAIEHSKQRVQFGKPIGEFQMVQTMLADMATDIFAARMMVLNTAWEVDQGRDPRDKISMVKLFASEMIGRVADAGIQIFGGLGYTKDLPLERIYRDCRVMRIYDGTSEIHRMVIAKHIMKNGLSV